MVLFIFYELSELRGRSLLRLIGRLEEVLRKIWDYFESNPTAEVEKEEKSFEEIILWKKKLFFIFFGQI